MGVIRRTSELDLERVDTEPLRDRLEIFVSLRSSSSIIDAEVIVIGDFGGASYPCPYPLTPPFGIYEASMGWTAVVGLL